MSRKRKPPMIFGPHSDAAHKAITAELLARTLAPHTPERDDLSVTA